MAAAPDYEHWFAAIDAALPGGYRARRPMLTFGRYMMVSGDGAFVHCQLKIRAQAPPVITRTYYVLMIVSALCFWPALIIFLVGLPGRRKAEAAAAAAIATAARDSVAAAAE